MTPLPESAYTRSPAEFQAWKCRYTPGWEWPQFAEVRAARPAWMA